MSAELLTVCPPCRDGQHWDCDAWRDEVTGPPVPCACDEANDGACWQLNVNKDAS